MPDARSPLASYLYKALEEEWTAHSESARAALRNRAGAIPVEAIQTWRCAQEAREGIRDRGC